MCQRFAAAELACSVGPLGIEARTLPQTLTLIVILTLTLTLTLSQLQP